jgi:hypothetical protein
MGCGGSVCGGDRQSWGEPLEQRHVGQFIDVLARGWDVGANVMSSGVDVPSASSLLGGSSNSLLIASGSVIVGGFHNMIQGNHSLGGVNRGVIIGGADNEILGAAAIQTPVILGGTSNTVTASYAMAGGRRSRVTHQGSMVLSDSQNIDKDSDAADELKAVFQGGMMFDLGTSTLTNRGSMQVTNSLVVGTNGPIHSTNIFQVATSGDRKALEVATDDKVFIGGGLTLRGGFTNINGNTFKVNASADPVQIDVSVGTVNFGVNGSSANSLGFNNAVIYPAGGSKKMSLGRSDLIWTNAYVVCVTLQQESLTPSAASIGGTVGSVTNHVMKNVNGALVDYWSDGTTVWSKQLAP